MEQWELDFYWLKVRHKIKDAFNASDLPDTDAILFLIGVQELGKWEQKFSKEEKIDLIKLGLARLMSRQGYFEFSGKDENGWPVFGQLKDMDHTGKEQEHLLKREIIHFFDGLSDES